MNLMRVTSKLLRMSPARVKWLPVARGAVYLDQDWMPGPYPKTEAERLAAAKKYNLLPEEYEPYDPDQWELHWGDYPHLPNICFWDKNTEYAWDYQCHHHNYGEVWHAYGNTYTHFMPAINHKDEFSIKTVFSVYFVVLGTISLMTLGFLRYDRILKVKPPQSPYFDEEVHYHYPNSKLSVYY